MTDVLGVVACDRCAMCERDDVPVHPSGWGDECVCDGCDERMRTPAARCDAEAKRMAENAERADVSGDDDPGDELELQREADRAATAVLDEPNPSGEEPDEPVAADVFFDKHGLCVQCLGEYIERGALMRVGHDRRVYRYDHGVFLPDGETHIRVQVRRLLGQRFRRRYADEAVAWIKSQWPGIGVEPPSRFINVANGLLDWRTGELLAHDPEVGSTIQLPMRWDPGADCPRIRAFLTDVLPADAIDFVLEVVGYAAYVGNPFRKAVMFLGAGGNGKSQLLTLLTRLVGEENSAAVALQDLAENRFSKVSLYGKLANIVGDLDARAVRRTDTFKKATGGDWIEAEHKYGRPFAFRSFALPIFSANEAPHSSDQSDAWFDRWLVVPFGRRFEGTSQAIPDLGEKLAGEPGELEGLLVQAVAGLRRLMDRGRFELPPSVAAAGERYRDRLDTVRGFLADECIVDPDAWVSRSQLYRAYATWTKAGGRLALSNATFYEHLGRALGAAIDERKRHGTRGYLGVGLVTDDVDGP